jgi:hypothetical protein
LKRRRIPTRPVHALLAVFGLRSLCLSYKGF